MGGYTRRELMEIAGRIRKYANQRVKHQYLVGVNGRQVGFVNSEMSPVDEQKLNLMASQIESIIPDDYTENSLPYTPSILSVRRVSRESMGNLREEQDSMSGDTS